MNERGAAHFPGILRVCGMSFMDVGEWGGMRIDVSVLDCVVDVVALMVRVYGTCILWMTMCWIVCAGVVSTLAGSGTAAWADGLGTAASFYFPYGVSVDSNGAVYVADYGNQRIRKVSSSGVCMNAALHILGENGSSIGA